MDVGTQTQSEDDFIDAAGLSEDPDLNDEWSDPLGFTEPELFSPQEDDHGNTFMLVVDVTGMKPFPVVWCTCANTDRVLHCIDSQMLPASHHDIKTVFTFRMLKHFRLANLEAKTSAYQYHHMLRRITNSAFPHLVPNRYTEFVRVTREWRNLIYLRWHGFGIRAEESGPENTMADSLDVKLATPGPADLALFCPACPQPGINLPDDWKTKYSE